MTSSTAAMLARSAMLRGFAEQARQCGLDAEALAREAGVDPAALRTGDLHAPAAAMAGLYELAAARSGADDFALRVVARRRMSNLGSIALLAREARTLRQALWTIQRYLWAQNEALGLSMEEAGPDMLLQAVPHIRAHKQSIDLCLGMLVVAIRYLAGDAWAPRAVLLPYARPAQLKLYHQVFGVMPRFDQDAAAILVTGADLDTALPAADPDFVTDLQSRMEEATRARQTGFVPGVRSLIAQQLRVGDCGIERVAGTLGLSPRSLQRQLADQGATFTGLVDETRRLMVVPLLLDSRRSMQRVSDLLGFASAGSFNDWFRQRFDCSPSSYRARSGAP